MLRVDGLTLIPLQLDLEELINSMMDDDTKTILGRDGRIQNAKLQRAFASKACRKSVMIGDALNKKQMEKVRTRVVVSFLENFG